MTVSSGSSTPAAAAQPAAVASSRVGAAVRTVTRSPRALPTSSLGGAGAPGEPDRQPEADRRRRQVVPAEGGRVALGNHPAASQDRHAVGELGGLLQVVGGEQDRGAVGGEGTDQLQVARRARRSTRWSARRGRPAPAGRRWPAPGPVGAAGRPRAHRCAGSGPCPGPLAIPHVGLLAPQQVARLVIDTITRFCHSDAAQIEPWHVPKTPGLDDPASIAVLRQALVPLAHRAWADLSNPDGRLRFTHDCYPRKRLRA